MDKKVEKNDDQDAFSEKKLNKLKGSIKTTQKRIETFSAEKSASKDINAMELEVKLRKLVQLQAQLDKISEQYWGIETSEDIETILEDIEQIKYGLKKQSNNEQLNDSQKLYYFRACLRGEAKFLESSSDNVHSLFKALSDHYENQRQLIDFHILEIINLEKIRSESAKELCALMDCVNKNIRVLI
ncbi:hypothetical protein HNY73_022190 [Argiope bruennichi]|uniref:Uncharacterized protein n=1 Tax=Argiope bruennichi TaxID=94029 RepID=A0A8T0E2E8_ARGBR|nr:hypothetical protein HNY73_022190 [Argiope bruennichi]